MQTSFPQSPQAPQPWYSQRWPWLLMLGPALVVVAGVITGWLAYTRQDAMVVDDYYKRGKTINMDLRRDRAASVLKMSFQASYDPAAGKLEGQVSSFGRPYATPVRILMVHSTQPGKDLALDASPDAAGRFSVALPLLEKARWSVTVEGPQREWRLASQWMWPAQAAVAIDADQVAAP
jgi:uncharacterized protein